MATASVEVFVRQQKGAAPAVRDLPWSLLGLLVTLGCGGDPAAPAPDDGADNRTFAGTYDLRAVDGVALPTAVHVEFMDATMQVGSGALTFGSGRQVSVSATGPLGSASEAVSLGASGEYVRIGADSLKTTTGVEGRVWGDSAEIRTGPWTVLGVHVWRYVRVAGP